MSKDGYFIITSGEGGIVIKGPMSAEELLKRITPDEDEEEEDSIFLDKVPDFDSGYFSFPGKTPGEAQDLNPVLIIKGSIVVPQPKKVVATYALPEDER